MSWEIIYSERAKQDLRDIYEYIAIDLLVPGTAKQQVNKLRSVIRSLDEMPMRHPVYDAEPLKSQGIRMVAVGKYLVFYLPNETEHSVTVVRIIFGGRDLTQQEME